MKQRKVHGPDYKAKVGLDAVRGEKTIHQIAEQFGVHPSQVDRWKQEILTGASQLFNVRKRGPKPCHEGSASDGVNGQMNLLKKELASLKVAVRLLPMTTRMAWIVPENEPPVTRQCALAGVSRATYDARRSRQACIREACPGLT